MKKSDFYFLMGKHTKVMSNDKKCLYYGKILIPMIKEQIIIEYLERDKITNCLYEKSAIIDINNISHIENSRIYLKG